MNNDLDVMLFTGPYAFLSNFYPCQLIWHGLEFATVEHAYQYNKMLYPLDAELIRVMATPGRARRLGHKFPMRQHWDQIKMTTMYDLLWEKFNQNPNLGMQLIDTFPRKLIEGNRWNDVYWGMVEVDGQLVGTNTLGKLLMLIRKQLTLSVQYAYKTEEP